MNQMTSLVLPEKFDANFINKNFFYKEWKGRYLDAINSGRCYDWAYIAYCLWSDVLLWTTDSHAWVQVGNSYFDSESIYGLKDHRKLRCNTVWPGDELKPTVMTIRNFKIYWNEHGGGSTHHWPKLIKKMLGLGLTPIRR